MKLNKIGLTVDLCKENSIYYREGVELSKISQIKAGGKVEFVIYPDCINNLIKLIKLFYSHNIDYFVIGNLSNLLIRDGNISTIFISMIKLRFNNSIGEDKFEIGSGLMMPALSNFAKKKCYSGLEGLSGIPGTIGGGVYMNAGSYGSTISTYVEQVVCIDNKGSVVKINKENMSFGWRHSCLQDLKKKYIVASVVFKFNPGERGEIYKNTEKIKRHRLQYQEKKYPNLGSLFATKDIYIEISKIFKLYAIFLLLIRAFARLFPKKRHKIYAKLSRLLTILYFKIPKHEGVGISKYTFNCVVKKSNVSSDEIIKYIYMIQNSINYCVELENEILDDID